MGERRLFHPDTLAYRITRYDYDRDTGAIRNPAVHYQGRERDGLPDGIAIDVEDHLWVAFWGAGVVRRLDPRGRVTADVPIPARHPSRVMFGGPSRERHLPGRAGVQVLGRSARRTSEVPTCGVVSRFASAVGLPLHKGDPELGRKTAWPQPDYMSNVVV